MRDFRSIGVLPDPASSKSGNNVTAARCSDDVRHENCSCLVLGQSVGQRTERVPEAAAPSRYIKKYLTLFVIRRIFDKLETNTLHTCFLMPFAQRKPP